MVSLIARMGVQVALDVPEVELIGPQPPLRGTHLGEALVDLGSDLVPGTRVVQDAEARCELTLALGDSPAAASQTMFRVTGGAWAGAVAKAMAAGDRWNAEWPIGGMTAAVLAASEVFKAAVGVLPLRHPVWKEFLAPCNFASWDFEGNGVTEPSKHRVPVDIISAGAISQAALFALFRLPIGLDMRIFDADVAELANVNRQMLFRQSDSGLKVDLVALSAPASFGCQPVPEPFCLPASNRHLPLAPHVLVGVDDIPVRWEVQRATDGWLGIGATTHFEASISSHESRQPCAGCLHPVDDPRRIQIPTVSFVSFWAGLALAVRFLLEVGDRGYKDECQHLYLSPLRMDQKNAALWSPVAPRKNCPVGCIVSQL